MAENYKAGKEVLSYCNKCKLTLAHTIVVMKDTMTIGKVECRTCHSVHSYKDPSSVKMKKPKVATKSKPKAKTASRSDRPVEDVWMEAMNSTATKSQAYVPTVTFKTGDIIDHSSFGPGVVDQIIDQNKIQVIFRHDIKILIHNR